jgi:hypothetical protein
VLRRIQLSVPGTKTPKSLFKDHSKGIVMKPLVFGALAGLAATMAMTAVMRRGHKYLPIAEQYPLPPREIVDRTMNVKQEEATRSATMLSHFGFGALAGLLYALPPLNRVGGPSYGLGVWAASYLGWLPAFRILAPATDHPAQRNLLMLAAHVVWGLALTKCLEELDAADRAFGRVPGEGRLLAERVEMESGS